MIDLGSSVPWFAETVGGKEHHTDQTYYDTYEPSELMQELPALKEKRDEGNVHHDSFRVLTQQDNLEKGECVLNYIRYSNYLQIEAGGEHFK